MPESGAKVLIFLHPCKQDITQALTGLILDAAVTGAGGAGKLYFFAILV